MIAGFADVVGMTVGAECVAANQLGLDYAAVCIVDNLANGLDDGTAHAGGVRGGHAGEPGTSAAGARRVCWRSSAREPRGRRRRARRDTVGLRAVDGAIVALGPDVGPEAGDEVLDGAAPALPGFVNGHTHAAMTLFRGYGGDLR